MTFYRCEHCGNIIAHIQDSGVRCHCCGEEMKPLTPNTTDAAGEKHVPVVQVNGRTVTVTVGSVEHPMLEAHYIQANFALTEGDEVIAAYEYCNLHGLWKSE